MDVVLAIVGGVAGPNAASCGCRKVQDIATNHRRELDNGPGGYFYTWVGLSTWLGPIGIGVGQFAIFPCKSQQVFYRIITSLASLLAELSIIVFPLSDALSVYFLNFRRLCVAQ